MREGSIRGCGIRVSQSAKGSDSWVDDPITRHIIGIYIEKEDEAEENNKHLLWPLVLHKKENFCILVLPLVEPRHLKAYTRLCNKSDCGNAVGVEDSISSILLDLPSITGLAYGNNNSIEADGNNNSMVNVEEFLMEKMSKDLPLADLEDPFCWHAYNYAKVSFKIVGASLSGMSIDPKSEKHQLQTDKAHKLYLE